MIRFIRQGLLMTAKNIFNYLKYDYQEKMGNICRLMETIKELNENSIMEK